MTERERCGEYAYFDSLVKSHGFNFTDNLVADEHVVSGRLPRRLAFDTLGPAVVPLGQFGEIEELAEESVAGFGGFNKQIHQRLRVKEEMVALPYC